MPPGAPPCFRPLLSPRPQPAVPFVPLVVQHLPARFTIAAPVTGGHPPPAKAGSSSDSTATVMPRQRNRAGVSKWGVRVLPSLPPGPTTYRHTEVLVGRLHHEVDTTDARGLCGRAGGSLLACGAARSHLSQPRQCRVSANQIIHHNVDSAQAPKLAGVWLSQGRQERRTAHR